MQRRGAAAKMGVHQPDQLRGQRDLRHQQQGGPSPLQALGDQLQIDGGLSAARHAVKQRGTGPLSGPLGQKRVENLLLLPGQDDRPRRCGPGTALRAGGCSYIVR